MPQIYGFYSLAPGEVSEATNLPYVRTNANFTTLLDFMGVAQLTSPGSLYEWTPRPSAIPFVTAGQKPVFADDQTVIDAFFQTNANLRRTVFLPEDARTEVSAVQSAGAQARLKSFSNQRIDIQTDAPASCLAVISQTFYQAWKARVDGQPARIWRANYAFQAVQVPAGRHELQLRYEDRPFLIGTALSGIGLAVCLVLWLTSGSRAASVVSQESLYILEPKRQRTAALQDADAPANAPELARHLGVRLSSAAFWGPRKVMAIRRHHTSRSRVADPPPAVSA